MQVLSVTSEAFPLVKTGGLADVAGALPPALAGLGIGMRTLLPGYPVVMERLENQKTVLKAHQVLGTTVRLLSGRAGPMDLLVIDAPELFDRPGGPYSGPDGNDHPDNWLRFGVLARCGADIASGLLPSYKPDVLHAHDWQAAMAPAYLHYAGTGVPSVLTIHNLAFQGRYSAEIFGALDLPPAAFAMDGVEYYGGVGYLKAGMQWASAITTVSPTYAGEITTPHFGMGLDGLVSVRRGALHGIVNGIDPDIWDPATDPHLATNYTSRTLTKRKANRRAIEEHFGLDTDASPLFMLVTRLTWQKGIDLLAEVTPALVASGGRLAVLGSGDAALEGRFLALASAHRGRVGVHIGYDEPLSHLMQGGGDAILVPSRFEPCGLTQLYGLRYGCVPVVARTGGLADTVIDANTAALQAGVATGLQHAPDSGAALAGAIERATALHATPQTWRKIQRQGMKSDVSWTRSAAEYAALYSSLIPTDEGRQS